MLRLSAFCLAFALLAVVSTIAVPATERSVTETAVRGAGELSRGQPDTERRGLGNQAGSADEEVEPNSQAGVSEPERTGPADSAIRQATEPAETEPLTPIETASSIRVNANVSLPQDI